MTPTDGEVQWSLKLGPRPTQGVQIGTNGNGAKDRTKDKLQQCVQEFGLGDKILQCRPKAHSGGGAGDRAVGWYN